MRYLITVCCVLFAGPALLAAADSPEQQQASLKASLEKWEKAKEECGGNYSYTVSQSSFSGARNVTTIRVRDNKVVERSYEAHDGSAPVPVPPGEEPAQPAEQWIEDTAETLGTHPKGASAKTLDELYAEAGKILASEIQPAEKLYLKFDKAGLLKLCFVIDTRIADDAPMRGVNINTLTLEKTYFAPNGKAFPSSWGEPPRLQTRDLRPLPGGYGQGSGTLAKWIQENLDRDANR